MRKMQNILSAACLIACGVLVSSLSMAVNNKDGVLSASDDIIIDGLFSSQEKKIDQTDDAFIRQTTQEYHEFAQEIGKNKSIVQSVYIGGEEDNDLSGGTISDQFIPVTVTYKTGTLIRDIAKDQSIPVRDISYGGRGLQEGTMPHLSGRVIASSPEAADKVETYLQGTPVGYSRNGSSFTLGGARRANMNQLSLIDPYLRSNGLMTLTCHGVTMPNNNKSFPIDNKIIVRYDADSGKSTAHVSSPIGAESKALTGDQVKGKKPTVLAVAKMVKTPDNKVVSDKK